MVATFASESFETINNLLFFLFFLILAVGIPAATGIAILKNRLYEIDLVIRKTLVFGALATIVTAIYVAIVVVIGTTTTGVVGAVPDRDGDRGRALPTDPAARRAPRRPARLRPSRRAVRGARAIQRARGGVVRRRRRDPADGEGDRGRDRRNPRRDLAPGRRGGPPRRCVARRGGSADGARGSLDRLPGSGPRRDPTLASTRSAPPPRRGEARDRPRGAHGPRRTEPGAHERAAGPCRRTVDTGR